MKEPDDVSEIKRALRQCKTAGDVHGVADHYRAKVQALHKMPDTKVFAIQIINLKQYLLQQFRSDAQG